MRGNQEIQRSQEIPQQEIPNRPVREKKTLCCLEDYVINVKMCTCIYVPDTYEEAVNSEDSVRWKNSMDAEMENL